MSLIRELYLGVSVMEKLAIGQALQRQGHPKRAMQAYLDGLAQVQQSAGDEAAYWLAIADLEHEAEQFTTALSLHQRALSLARCEKQQCAARLGLAADLWVLGEQSTALALQQKALTFDGLHEDPVLLEESARLYRLQQQWRPALQQLRSAAALNDGDGIVLHLAILQTYLQLDTNEGLADAVMLAKQSLESSHLHHQESLLLALAQCCERLANYSEAVQFYQAALSVQTTQKATKKTPRRLLGVELKLQQTISGIEIELLRHSNAQQIEQVRRLESATYRDALTGLHNLRYLQARWDELLTCHSLCLIHMGVDQSTHLRDVMGDEVANDSALRIANVLRRCCPEDGVLVAANNNEFRLVLLKTSVSEVNVLIQTIQAEIALLDCSQLPEALTLSVGCTAFKEGDKADVLQLRADLALYLAMRKGAGAIVWEGEA
jgi:diguanylate cyclase (GGDEF)-like protein